MINLIQLEFNYKQMPMQFDLQIRAGEKIALIGASGAGKSTLLNLIAGFEQPDSGQIWLNGENHSHSQPHLRPVSMLFQENNLFNHLSVAQNIILGLQPNLNINAEQQQAVLYIADKVGLTPYLSRLPEQLSGGQKQRIALARCMLRDKPILLLDEPFSALDTALRQEMLQLLAQICRDKNLTLLMVTHQPQEVTDFVDRTLTVDHGSLIDNRIL
ncbi:thiamine ABC transporter ATP-binding protein [Testudinibacter sp. TR-2022]|nr:thiamine ABC transporter ATP-binding protein [Testudinibacter sp. TR-2022]TNH05386.1 thiamine ABC transporter ATP-binding protein [Pasteurellaceae bacterium Phil31]TNH09929.1 thiamine ABC transporter ATP-binding protein [Testudinibacter sp. TR-2022]TNH12189.1 thiamine ABC transporter ATP-binding protein [Testudinibacter sp. TR-2022]TNH14813.1 thiamine ABC transporter ATP-binding protein [Testudinibacter sp. TR-2022]TNH15449.1 thiamine ABC transporter ATP-binding protein [Testudinibacter sp.